MIDSFTQKLSKCLLCYNIIAMILMSAIKMTLEK